VLKGVQPFCSDSIIATAVKRKITAAEIEQQINSSIADIEKTVD